MTKKPSAGRRSLPTTLVMSFMATLTFFGLVFYFFPHWLPFMQQRSEASLLNITPVAVDPNAKTEQGQPVITGKPVRIQVPSVNIDLGIEDGIYDQKTQKWTLSTKTAHYAVITPQPNNAAGNTFIYGHNRASVFARLLKMKEGEMAIIKTDTAHSFTYILRSITDVDPSDVSLFQYQGKPILTVQTCSGTWYENRRLFTFDFVSVEPAT